MLGITSCNIFIRVLWVTGIMQYIIGGHSFRKVLILIADGIQRLSTAVSLPSISKGCSSVVISSCCSLYIRYQDRYRCDKSSGYPLPGTVRVSSCDLLMSAMESQSSSTDSMRWVENKMVAPFLFKLQDFVL